MTLKVPAQNGNTSRPYRGCAAPPNALYGLLRAKFSERGLAGAMLCNVFRQIGALRMVWRANVVFAVFTLELISTRLGPQRRQMWLFARA